MKPAVHFGKPDSNVMLHTLKIFSKWILDFEEFIVANQHLWLLWFCMLLDQALCILSVNRSHKTCLYNMCA